MSVRGKSLSLDPERRHTYPVCEESGALVTQLSEPPIPGLIKQRSMFRTFIYYYITHKSQEQVFSL